MNAEPTSSKTGSSEPSPETLASKQAYRKSWNKTLKTRVPWKKESIRIDINSPLILTYAALSLVALLLHTMTGGATTRDVFSLPGSFDYANPLFYIRLFTYTMGSWSWAHFLANFTIILLVGPLLEEKYGTLRLSLFTLLTALITGIFHTLIFNSTLLGASGITFMMILLTSFANYQKNTIPLTFLIVSVLFLGKEIASAFGEDHISQFAHIMGGACGAAFGIWWGIPKSVSKGVKESR